jgi:methionyl aminopeptidase
MSIDSEKDLLGLMRIGRIVALGLKHMQDHVRVGMTTAELDAIGAALLKQHGARSAPILAYKFPGYTCISINDEAAHGIPGRRVIQPGDLVNIDVSAELDGYWADTGATVPMPPVSPLKQKLCDFTKVALERAIDAARAGQPFRAVGKAVEAVARQGGFRIIEELGGHGVGRHIHEKPQISNFNNPRNRGYFKEGMVLTLEPFLTTGAIHVETQSDGWTLKTTDGSLSCQYEHTVVITKGRPILVTGAS